METLRFTPSRRAIEDASIHRIRSCYDEGKRIAETLCFDYKRMNNVDVRVARIFNTYGPRMLIDDGRVVGNFIVQALRGEPLTLYGDGPNSLVLLCQRFGGGFDPFDEWRADRTNQPRQPE